MKKLSVANGTYVNRDGQTKTSWVQVGVIGTSQNGKEYMLIDPTINFAGFKREEGKNMVMVGIFEETNQNQGQAPVQGGYAPPVQTPPHQGQPPAQYGGQVPPPQNNPPVEYYDANGQPIPPRG